MTISVSKNIKSLSSGDEVITYTVSPEKIEFQLALNAIVNWRDSKRLLDFAISRHGYGNTDSMCGIKYETDLDEYERQVEKVNIPIGCVQAYSDYHLINEKNLTEFEYLMILKSFFEIRNELNYSRLIETQIEDFKLPKTKNKRQ